MYVIRWYFYEIIEFLKKNTIVSCKFMQLYATIFRKYVCVHGFDRSTDAILLHTITIGVLYS